VVVEEDEATFSQPFLRGVDAGDVAVEMMVAAAGCLLLSRVGALVHLGATEDVVALWLRFRPEERVAEGETVAGVA
jgi:hypothetical protein